MHQIDEVSRSLQAMRFPLGHMMGKKSLRSWETTAGTSGILVQQTSLLPSPAKMHCAGCSMMPGLRNIWES